MKLIVFFDLPTNTREERKEYGLFRKQLIKLGFSMMQYSVYVRTLPNRDAVGKYTKLVKNIIPSAGSVRVLAITDRQYDSMEILLGEQYETEDYLDNRNIIEI